MKKLHLWGIIALVATVFVACNSQNNAKASEEKYVVILSMDAYRHDLSDLYDTPTLDSIASVGVFSKVAPCFPSNTFPNHYSMATGLHSVPSSRTANGD